MGTVNGNAFELFDVSLTEGSVAPPFVVPDYAERVGWRASATGKDVFERTLPRDDRGTGLGCSGVLESGETRCSNT